MHRLRRESESPAPRLRPADGAEPARRPPPHWWECLGPCWHTQHPGRAGLRHGPSGAVDGRAGGRKQHPGRAGQRPQCRQAQDLGPPRAGRSCRLVDRVSGAALQPPLGSAIGLPASTQPRTPAAPGRRNPPRGAPSEAGGLQWPSGPLPTAEKVGADDRPDLAAGIRAHARESFAQGVARGSVGSLPCVARSWSTSVPNSLPASKVQQKGPWTRCCFAVLGRQGYLYPKRRASYAFGLIDPFEVAISIVSLQPAQFGLFAQIASQERCRGQWRCRGICARREMSAAQLSPRNRYPCNRHRRKAPLNLAFLLKLLVNLALPYTPDEVSLFWGSTSRALTQSTGSRTPIQLRTTE